MRTSYDRALDEATHNAGRQRFEKMLSGMYLGELVRITLEVLARDGALFGGDTTAIAKRGCFPTKFVSEVSGGLLKERVRWGQAGDRTHKRCKTRG